MTAPQEEEVALSETRARATIVVSSIVDAQRLVADQGVSASKWLLNTLVTVNGGGALATISLAPTLSNPVLPAILFSAGMLASILNGVLNQQTAEWLVQPHTDMLVYWSRVERSGIRDEAAEKACQASYDSAHRWGLLAPLAGWIGGKFFIAGLVTLAIAAGSGDPANDRRCAAIQADMLSSHPLRKDDAALFTALGCRPHGEGSVYAPVEPRHIGLPGS